MTNSQMTRRAVLSGLTTTITTGCANADVAANLIISSLSENDNMAASYPLTNSQTTHIPERIPALIFAYTGTEETGTVLVNLDDRKLYLVQGLEAIEYPIAVGKVGRDVPYNEMVIGNSRWWPSWKPTTRMRREKPSLRKEYPGGPQNPHGVAKAYLYETHRDSAGQPVKGEYTVYGIHGTNDEDSIGTEASSGCWRMFNRHAADFVNRISGPNLNLVKIFQTSGTSGIGDYLAFHRDVPLELPPHYG